MKVLVISPHPDDESIGCGGTLRKHIVAGDKVQVIFLTSGEKGGHGLGEAETRRVREEEAVQATRRLGIPDIEFWREADGAVRASRKLVERCVHQILAYAPDLIYVTNEDESHRDHRAAARLIRAARQQIGSLPRVLAYEVWTPLQDMDDIVDITPYIDVKIAAISAYQSQCRMLNFPEAMLGLARYRGEMFSWPKDEEAATGKYAEVFRDLRY